MNAHTHSIQTVPLAQIGLSHMNPRQTHDPQEIEALAMSIAVAGLLQPLACYRAASNRVEVVDGGRRLLALQHLKQHGTDLVDWKRPDWSAIPCNVTDDDFQAQAWAGAAAASVVPLTPTQEIRAYCAMSRKGLAPESISRAFAVTTRHVNQRLKLASLSEETLDSLAAGDITLDVAKVLTLAPSPSREVEVLRIATDRRWGPTTVRHELAQGSVTATDRRVKYVGIEAYVAAGGAVIEDMFEDHTILQDITLLDRLFGERLKAEADAATEAWAWCVTIHRTPFLTARDTEECERVHRTPGTLTEADMSERDRLLEAYEDDDISPADENRLEELEERIAGDWTDAEYETCGAFAYIDSTGELIISGGWRRRDAGKDTSGDAEDDKVDKVDTAPKQIPDNCRQDFGRIALVAAQTAALGKFDQLLFLLAFQMEAGHVGYTKPLAIDLNPPDITPEKDSGLRIDARLKSPERDFNSPSMEDFEAFVAKGVKNRNAILTRHLARCIGPQTLSRFQQALIESWAPDIRAIWTPDALNCFGRMPADMLDAIWAELVPSDKAELASIDFAAIKRKADKAKNLERLFSDAGFREALGLNREEAAAIDAWVPVDMCDDA